MTFHASQIRRCLLAAAVAQALFVMPAVAQSASTNQTASDNQAVSNQRDADKEKSKEPLMLKTVVVTAQRRTQDLQEVPISVTAMDAAELQARGITNVADLSAAAPSLVVMSGIGGNPSTV